MGEAHATGEPGGAEGRVLCASNPGNSRGRSHLRDRPAQAEARAGGTRLWLWREAGDTPHPDCVSPAGTRAERGLRGHDGLYAGAVQIDLNHGVARMNTDSFLSKRFLDPSSSVVSI